MNEGKKGGMDRCGRRCGGARAERVKFSHTFTLYVRTQKGQRTEPSMLRRTYYGARQYLNTLDGKVVHEGEIGIPIVLRCEACARKGVDGETIGAGGGRRGGGEGGGG